MEFERSTWTLYKSFGGYLQLCVQLLLYHTLTFHTSLSHENMRYLPFNFTKLALQLSVEKKYISTYFLSIRIIVIPKKGEGSKEPMYLG